MYVYICMYVYIYMQNICTITSRDGEIFPIWKRFLRRCLRPRNHLKIPVRHCSNVSFRTKHMNSGLGDLSPLLIPVFSVRLNHLLTASPHNIATNTYL